MAIKFGLMNTIYAGEGGTVDRGAVLEAADTVIDDLVARAYAVEVATADGLPAAPPVVVTADGATITVSDESANVRTIAVQLTDDAGQPTNIRQAIQIALLADANGDAFATTGGSTGIEVGADGALLTIVSKKLFLAITEADGALDLTWTDTGTEVAYLAVILPDRRLVVSSALTNT